MSGADLGGSSLLSRYKGLICDLDGVVYRGPVAVPGAVESVRHALDSGVRVVFATNNASRPPADVASHLRTLGLLGPRWQVVTSAQAAAMLLAACLEPGTPVLAVGGPGVSIALAEAGLRPLNVAEAQGLAVRAVVQGAGPDVSWRDLAEVAFRVTEGAMWIATNTDLTIPTSRGLAPGNGSLVAAVQTAVEIEPQTAGKPHPPLFRLSVELLDIRPAEVLVIGDRLDTDVAGAIASGLDSLFVLGGTHELRDLALCEAAGRPTHFSVDLRGLRHPALQHPMPPRELVTISDAGDVRLDPSTGCAPDAYMAAIVTAAWSARGDRTHHGSTR